MIYVVHVVAGTLGLLAGYTALYSAKGAATHRRAGMVFVYTMLVMCVGGALLAVIRNKAPAINIPASLLTSYLVLTALATVRPSVLGSRPADLGSRPIAVVLMLVALGVGTTMLVWGLEAVANGGTRNGMPAFPFFMFATFGLLGAAGDIHVLRSGARAGAARLARHLWRMSIALFIAALSFSVQAASLLSRQGVRVPGVMIALPMLAVLVTMFYWLWRVRGKRSLRGVMRISIPEAA